MNFLKNKAYTLILFLCIFTISIFLYTFLIYKGKITADQNIQTIICYIIGIFSFFILGLINGIIEQKKGLLNSLICSSIIVGIALIIKLISKEQFNAFIIIRYLSYLLICMIGGILGVNIKKPKITRKKLKK